MICSVCRFHSGGSRAKLAQHMLEVHRGGKRQVVAPEPKPIKPVEDKELIGLLSKLETVGRARALMLINLGLDTYEKVANCDIQILIDLNGVTPDSAIIIQKSAVSLQEVENVGESKGNGLPNAEAGENAEGDGTPAEVNSKSVGSEDSDQG